MNRVKYWILLVVAALALAACGDGDSSDTTTTTQVTTTTQAATTSSGATTIEGDVVTGGLLYDKWWVIAGVNEPVDDNPMWGRQTTNERSGADTWRCKECHGWDYKGAEGAYGSGSHSTGFPGVFDAQSKSVEDLVAQIAGQVDPDHDFSAMGDDAVADLAAFIQEGLADYTPMIDGDKQAIGGDSGHGGELFALCSACHGADGTTLNFGSDDDPEFVGTIASDNPWEFFHKVRAGQPGSNPPMPSAITNGWSLDDVLDVLTYAQTLPTEAGSAAHLDEVVLGGLLYDKWWSVVGLVAPVDDNPMWGRQTTNERSGADTWRCKECHGWDYKGAEGAYGSGSHSTGFPGVFDAQSKSPEDLVAQIGGEIDPDHDFSTVLGHDELHALAAFITEGLDDYTPLIDPDKKAVGGDSASGETLFGSTCAACHGADGKMLNFSDDDDPEYVGTIASDNPWEFFHKVRAGQPGSNPPMPSAITNGWSLDDVLDVLTYAQTLPTE